MCHTPRKLPAIITLAVGCIPVALIAQLTPLPRVVKTSLPAEDIVIASLVVPAATPESDTTGRIQKAVDVLAQAGGGVVFLPAGHYRLDGRLVIREGVTLRGEWARPGKSGVRGTVLGVHADRGNPDAPAAITLERGSGIRDLSIWHPEQTVASFTPYPWTIRTSGKTGGDNVTCLNLTLVNPYRGISIGPEWNELHTIRDVFMTPLYQGIAIDSTTDIGRLVNVTMSPAVWQTANLPQAPGAAPHEDALREHLRKHATGVSIGRSDWEYIYGVKIDGLATGMVFRAGERGTTNAVMAASELRNCRTALRLERLNGIGLAVTGTTLAGTEAGLHTPLSFTTVAQFHSCTFEGPTANCVTQQGRGVLLFERCSFTGSVRADSGQTSILRSRFTGPRATVTLGSDVRRARLLGNTFEAGTPIRGNSAKADVLISHTTLPPAAVDVSPHSPASMPRPASASLIVVTDVGATPEAQDNTAAFQQALDRLGDGGGTVYVPAGNYRLKGALTVPTRVELRGCFDVPHHTISAGSVLMPTTGRGQETGTPFLRLESGAGVRGITVWYPEQSILDPAPYPWAIQSLGPRCWLVDVTLGNAWQGVDFASHDSSGHVIRYLAGAMFRRGLRVSKCDSDGWIEDLQFNPHYALRLHRSLPRPQYPPKADLGRRLIDYQRQHLEGIVLGRTRREHMRGTFLYAAFDGIAFKEDNGGANAHIIMHGTDTASRAAAFYGSLGDRGISFVNAQLVPLGKWVQAGIVAEAGFRGTVSFVNTQMWAGPTSAILDGQGTIRIEQMHTRSGPIHVKGGGVVLENVHFSADLTPHIKGTATCTGLDIISCLSQTGLLRFTRNSPGAMLANAASLVPDFLDSAAPSAFHLSMEPEAHAPVRENQVATRGGGMRTVSNAQCAVVPHDDAPSGGHVLRLAGHADDPSYSYVYFTIANGPFTVFPDAVLSYQVMPLDERGTHVGIDARFTDGKVLRDSGARDTQGHGVHPGGAKGPIGKWTRVSIPLGRFMGKTLDTIMAAYDSRGGGGSFSALFDDIRLTSDLAGTAWNVTATPRGGRTPAKNTRISLSAADSVRIRYTLDGTNPDPDAPLYQTPIPLPDSPLTELRFAAQTADGGICPIVFAELYERAP